MFENEPRLRLVYAGPVDNRLDLGLLRALTCLHKVTLIGLKSIELPDALDVEWLEADRTGETLMDYDIAIVPWLRGADTSGYGDILHRYNRAGLRSRVVTTVRDEETKEILHDVAFQATNIILFLAALSVIGEELREKGDASNK